MKFTLSILNNSFLQKLESSIAADSKNFLGEILIYPAALSKYGNFELSDFAAGLPDLKARKLVLVWDLLPDDEQLLEQSLILKSWLKFFKQSSQIISIRFQDPGVGFFLQQNHPDLKLQLSLERFSHNLHSASCWEKIFQPSQDFKIKDCSKSCSSSGSKSQTKTSFLAFKSGKPVAKSDSSKLPYFESAAG